MVISCVFLKRGTRDLTFFGKFQSWVVVRCLRVVHYWIAFAPIVVHEQFEKAQDAESAVRKDFPKSMLVKLNKIRNLI